MVIDFEHHIATEESFRNRNGVDGQMSWGLVREEIYRIDQHIDDVKVLDLPKETIDGILSGTAKKLLNI